MRTAHLSLVERTQRAEHQRRHRARTLLARHVLLDLLRFAGDLSPAEIAAATAHAHVASSSIRREIQRGVRAGVIRAVDVDGVRRYLIRR